MINLALEFRTLKIAQTTTDNGTPINISGAKMVTIRNTGSTTLWIGATQQITLTNQTTPMNYAILEKQLDYAIQIPPNQTNIWLAAPESGGVTISIIYVN